MYSCNLNSTNFDFRASRYDPNGILNRATLTELKAGIENSLQEITDKELKDEQKASQANMLKKAFNRKVTPIPPQQRTVFCNGVQCIFSGNIKGYQDDLEDEVGEGKAITARFIENITHQININMRNPSNQYSQARIEQLKDKPTAYDMLELIGQYLDMSPSYDYDIDPETIRTAEASRFRHPDEPPSYDEVAPPPPPNYEEANKKFPKPK